MTLTFPEHPFWDFSLSVYMNDVVPPACLAIQQQYTLDVNWVLFCCWIGASGRGVLAAAEIDQARGAVGHWNRDVVCGLRAIRGGLKTGYDGAPGGLAEDIRKIIAKTEIDSEHIEQLMLAGAIVRPVDDTRPALARADDAVTNIRQYLETLGITDVEKDMQVPFGVILARVFPELSADEVRRLAAELGA